MPKTSVSRARVAPSRVLYDVIEFLERKRLDVPAALRAACPAERAPPSESGGSPNAAQSADFLWALEQLKSLKERERRALTRFVEKKRGGGAAAKQHDAVMPAGCSDGESSDARGSAALGPPQVHGGSWPADVTYTNDYLWGDDVTEELLAKYRPAAPRRRPARPCVRVRAAVITEADHPALGGCGLFAAVDLPCGAWVLDYVGAVSLGANEDRTSDYVCDFGESSELALDANRTGNEGRFVNDYRNTGRRANVEFKLRRDARGELRQGVFVCAKEGIGAGAELLISYGKSFWRSRVGDMEAFIVRRPGEAAATSSARDGRGAEG